MMAEVEVLKRAMSLDLLLWRKFGVAGRSVIETTYDLNPHVATLGVILPAGTAVTLPPTPPASSVPTRKLITLWG